VEVKRRISAARGFRDAAVQLVQRLVETPEIERAYLVLVDPRLTDALLREQLESLRNALRPNVAERFRLIVARDGVPTFESSIEPDDQDEIRSAIAEAVDVPPIELPRPDLQFEVFKVILLEWTRGSRFLTSARIMKTVGCTFPTVASLIKRLGPVIERSTDKKIRLKQFPQEAFRRFSALARGARANIEFVDRSDQPRSPEDLIQRLRRLGRSDVAIGGVPGARRHQPSIDLIGSPRLDLCIHAPDRFVDLDFLRTLDPALAQVDEPDAPPRLVVHFLRRRESLFEEDGNGGLWADPVECLLDLDEMRLVSQAEAFVRQLSSRRTES
jgi:hypothetical protein